MNVAYCMDCMEAMAKMPDKCFDLAVVDPPYGGGGASSRETQGLAAGSTAISKTQINHAWWDGLSNTISVKRAGGWMTKYGNKIINWDYVPSDEYFKQLFRVSKNQIIWGGNYFALPPTRCFLVWNKPQIPENFSMAMVEYAWCSFNDNAKMFSCYSSNQEGRFHPTQKPVALYRWIYQRYAKDGDRVLDTHLGSGSSRIAAYDAGLDFVGFEIDPEYFEKEEERFNAYTAQMNLFLEETT